MIDDQLGGFEVKIHLLYTRYTPCIHPVYTLYTPCIHPLHTLYTPFIHPVYICITIITPSTPVVHVYTPCVHLSHLVTPLNTPSTPTYIRPKYPHYMIGGPTGLPPARNRGPRHRCEAWGTYDEEPEETGAGNGDH